MMEDKVLAYIEKHQMIENGDNVIVALSGGADSIALFRFLLCNQSKLGIKVEAAHFEHGLRGEESLRDKLFVQALCRDLGCRLHVGYGEMGARQKPPREGVESWARKLRYCFFEELAAQYQAKIATAHTLSDNAETVLFNAVRGSGPRGLGGIPPVRDVFIRPFLEISRQEIEEYCRKNRFSYVTDRTNLLPIYSRNRLRLEAMPALKAAHPGAEESLGRLAKDMRELDDWLQTLAMELEARARKPSEDRTVKAYNKEMLRQAPLPVRRQLFANLAGKEADRRALELMEQVLDGSLGAVQLTGERRALLSGPYFRLEPTPAGKFPLQSSETGLKEGEICLPGGYQLQVSVLDVAKNDFKIINNKETAQKDLTFAADYDKISRYSVFRQRKQGDRFSPAGRGLSKTVKKWMNEQKIPQHIREELPLLADKSNILWIWGAGFSDQVQPTGETKRVLVFQQKAKRGEGADDE